MKICLISEGSYPYVVGGVSSWIQQLISGMPDHQFVIVAINPESKVRGQYKYMLPENVVELKDVFLDELQGDRGKWNARIQFSTEEYDNFKAMVCMKDVDWPVWFKFFERCRTNGITADELAVSKCFYDLVQLAYNERYPTMSFMDIYWTMRSMFSTVFALLMKEYPDADIYHAVSTGYAGLVGSCAASLHEGALLVTEHGIYTREREEEIIKADWVKGQLKNIWIDFFYMLSCCAYSCSERVVTLFSKSRDIIIEIGCPSEKTEVIHNGIDLDRFKEIASRVKRKKPRQELKVGSITRVVPIKDIKTMLQSFSIVSARLPHVTFYIIGPTEEDPEYFQECLEYKEFLHLDKVVFTGKVDVRDYLSDMDLLVLTSISEGQPLAILEGFACRLPFVTTSVGDCQTLITGDSDPFGLAGMHAPVMDYVTIAECIIEMCVNHAFRAKCGNAAHQRVEKYYRQSFVIQQYRKLYEELDSRNR
jgi:polysaccharide biosynthesis protein PelF